MNKYLKFKEKRVGITENIEYIVIYATDNFFCIYDDENDFRIFHIEHLEHYKIELINK